MKDKLTTHRYSGLLKAIYVTIVLAIATIIAAPAIHIISGNIYTSARLEEAQTYCENKYDKNKKSNLYQRCYDNYLFDNHIYSNIDTSVAEFLSVATIITPCIVAFIGQIVAKAKVKNAIKENAPTIKGFNAIQIAIIVTGLALFAGNYLTLNINQCLDSCPVNTMVSSTADIIAKTNATAAIIISNILATLYVVTSIIMPTLLLLMAKRKQSSKSAS